jgi:hypothetical protein
LNIQLILCLSVGALSSAILPAATSAPNFDLVTAAEASSWNSPSAKPDDSAQVRELPKPGVPSCRANRDAGGGPDGPQITIAAPPLDKPLNAPLDIDVKFVQSGSAPIRADTFRVCYLGFVTMDITQRITEHVTVSSQGLHVAGANLPQGHHHLLMLIADEQGRLGRREASFDIR